MTYKMDFYDADPNEVVATLRDIGATDVEIGAIEGNLFDVTFDTNSITKLRAALMQTGFSDRWTEYRKVTR